MNKEIANILDKATPYLFGDEIDKLLNYIKNLESSNKDRKLKTYENMRKEAIEYIKSHFKEMVADEEAQILLNILNEVGGSDD